MERIFVRGLGFVGAIALLEVALSCGGGSKGQPPTAPTTPTPTPTEVPIGALSCPLGNGEPVSSFNCKAKSAKLTADVISSIDAAVAQKPELFDLNDVKGAGSLQYRVLDKQRYLEQVVRNLHGRGHCAGIDYTTAEHINVKNSNSFSEDYDIYQDSGHILRGQTGYVQTCTPASFPVEPDPNGPPPGSGCGRPYPPPIGRITTKIHLRHSGYWTLDSTALVTNNRAYCLAIGFTDNRSQCQVRPEGHPERVACEQWAVGYAEDTGRPGPTWYKDDELCTGAETTGCANHPENQFQVWAYKGGTATYKACVATTGVCDEVLVVYP